MKSPEVPLWALLRSREEFGAPDLPILTVTSEHGVSIRNMEQGGRSVSEDLSNYRVVSPGDLVVNKLWARFGAYGVSRDAGLISPAYWVLKPSRNIHPGYLHFKLRSSLYLAEIGRLSKNQPPNGFDLRWEDFRAIVVELPPIDEQRRIADFLDDQVARIGDIVAARGMQRELIDREQESLSDHLLSGYILCDTTRLGRFVRRIEQGWSPQCEAVGADDHEWGVLKVSAIRQGRFVSSENKRLPDDLYPQVECEVREGDLFVTRANTPKLVGAFAVAPPGTRPRLIFSDKIMRLTLSEGLNPEFVALVGQTRAVRDLLSSAGTGASQSMVNVRGSDIRDIRVPVVDTRSQRSLVARHREMTARIETERDLLERHAGLVNELKRSLITAAVTGDFDVSSADGSRVPV